MENHSWLKPIIIVLILAAVSGNVLFFFKMPVVADSDMTKFVIGGALFCNLMALVLLAWLRHLEWAGAACLAAAPGVGWCNGHKRGA